MLQGHCVKSCPENAIGLLLYRLVITNALLLNVVGVAQTLLLRCFFPQLYDPPEARTLQRLSTCSECPCTAMALCLN